MQGYITLALDHDRYVDMAVNLARSLKYFDKKRQTCLVYNERVSLPRSASVFDHAVKLPVLPDYVGCMNKIRLYDVTPFDETMYVDADCLMVKNDIDRHWHKAAASYFTMTGDKRTWGKWNNLDFEKVCKFFSVPYVVQMNSGVFYFARGTQAKKFFVRLDELYRDHRDFLSNIHQGRAGQYADEPIFGTAMGEFGLEPVGGAVEEGSWMVTTWRSRNCRFDPAHLVSRIDKPRRYWFGISHLPREWVVHSPTIAHFIGLKPRGLYKKTAAYFERALAAR